MRLIGLAGRAGAGKDSVAQIIAVDSSTSRIAFADPIRDMLLACFGLHFGLDRHTLTDPRRKEQPLAGLGVSPRVLMQKLGTEWGRAIDPDLWVKHLEARLKYHASFSRTIVITDVRFPNEAEWIYRKGGEVWHIVRPLTGNVYTFQAGHASEEGIGVRHGTDSVITNDGGLEQLADQVRAALAGELVERPRVA